MSEPLYNEKRIRDSEKESHRKHYRYKHYRREQLTKKTKQEIFRWSKSISSSLHFCNKDKFVKGSKTREKLTQAVTFNADQTLRECAIQKRDEKILAVTSRDVVAAEAHYHRSCYKEYTRIKKKEPKNQDNNAGTDGDEEYKRIEREAYKALFVYIRTDKCVSRRIDVFDTYKQNSIKNSERSLRGEET